MMMAVHNILLSLSFVTLYLDLDLLSADALLPSTRVTPSTQCYTPDAPVNGDVSCEYTSDLHLVFLCVFTCDAGFQFEGSNETRTSKVCRNGTRGFLEDPSTPPCVRSQTVVQNGALQDQESAICTTWGASHYRTFDDKVFSFRGDCKYLLAYCPGKFNILVTNDKTCIEKPCHRGLDIFFADASIKLRSSPSHGPQVTWNGRTFPVPGSKSGCKFEQVGKFLTLDSPVGFSIKWDGFDYVAVQVSSSLQNRVTGLCGKYNRDPADDFEGRNGQHLTTVANFVASWKQTSLNEPVCTEGKPEVSRCENKNPMLERATESQCQDILFNSDFNVCHGLVDPKPFFESCKSDCCQSQGQGCMCSTMEAYARLCNEYGLATRWRRQGRCEMKCEGGKEYKECGSLCVADCSNLPAVCSDTDCVEGCFCPDGSVLHNGTCIESWDCPCSLNGKEYASGISIKEDCNSCQCTQGQWDCTSKVCHAKCSLYGDAHYHTFDQTAFTFIGKCSYYLLRTENLDIVINNEGCSLGVECSKSIKILYHGQRITLDESNRVFYNDHEVLQLPYSSNNFLVAQVSSLFIELKLSNGISVMWDGGTRMQMVAPPSFKGRTKGLCGTYDDKQSNDLMTPQNVWESNPVLFANQWRTHKYCADVQVKTVPNPCDMQLQRKSFAQNVCQKLKSDIFADCLGVQDVEEHYKNCLFDVCSCEKNLADCVCPSFSFYADTCTSRGVFIDWRNQVEQCQLDCPADQVYQVCGRPCERTCHNLAGGEVDDCSNQCVEGCNCPDGQALNDGGECVAVADCPCVFGGKEYLPGFTTIKDTELCKCSNAKWQCKQVDLNETVQIHNLQSLCGPLMEYSPSTPLCPDTCGGAQETDDTCDASTERHPGCVCKQGYVLNGNTCIPTDQCPCLHGGKEYFEGDSFHMDCNQCVCTNQKWQCEQNECPATCVAYGDSHYTTFDGHKYDFQGSCDYVLAKSITGVKDRFAVTIQNVPCGTSGVTCSKGVNIILGEERTSNYHNLHLVRGKSIVKPWGSPFQIQEIGQMVFVQLPMGVTVEWDGGTRLYVRLPTTYMNKVEGLCGNFNGDRSDDFTLRHNGPPVVRPTLFGDSWRLHSYCEASKEIEDSCQLVPQRKTWALLKCSVLASELFEPCHGTVPYGDYMERCVFDACACDQGGDCECLCTAIAAYAHECAGNGIHIHWRTKDFCGLECTSCKEYNPCMSRCPKKTCENRLVFDQLSKDCKDERGVCFEGCDLHPCPEGQVYDSLVEPVKCLPEPLCEPPSCKISGKDYHEGERIDDASVCNQECEICICRNGEIDHITFGYCKPVAKVPTTITPIPNVPRNVTPTPSVTCAEEGWTSWMSSMGPSHVNVGDKETVKGLRKKYSFCGDNYLTDIRCRVIGQKEAGFYFGQHVTCDLESGFSCRHRNQDRGMCFDYEVSYYCNCTKDVTETLTTVQTTLAAEATTTPVSTVPPVTPKQPTPSCGWTKWMNSFVPNHDGDEESLSNLRLAFSFCAEPVKIMCRAIPDDNHPYGIRYDYAGQRAVSCDLNRGLICLNSVQQSGETCFDYEIMVQCVDACKTVTEMSSTPTPHFGTTLGYTYTTNNKTGSPTTTWSSTTNIPSTTSTATPGVPSTATPGIPSATSTATPGVLSTATPGVPSTATPGVPSTTSTATPGVPSTTSSATPGVPSTTSTATPGVPSTTSSATPGVPSTTSTATPGVPSTTSSATPGVPSTTSTATPGVPSTTSTATPGVPSTTSSATPGVPSTTSTATPGVPSTTSTATPGVPSTTSSATPGVPSTTSTATPGVPPTTSSATPGVPSTTSSATPGVPSTTSTATPGVPSTTSTATPGIPSTTSTTTPGIPSTTSTATPGVPSTTSSTTPGVPSTTSTTTPGVPSTTSTATPGVPSTTSTATPGVPSTTSSTTPGVPSTTSTATPGVPSTTSTATPGVPLTTSTATTGVPSTTSTATPGVPSTTSTTTPGEPSTTSTATPGVPSTTSTTTPGEPSTTSTATPGIPSTTSTASPGIPSTTSTATPGIPSTISTATPGVPSTISTTTPGIPSTTSTATLGVPSTISTTTPGIPSTTSTATPGIPSRTSTATPGIPSKTSTTTPGIPSTTSTATPGVPSTTSTATPGVPSTSTATPGIPSTRSTATPGVPSKTSTATPGIPSTTSTATPGIPSTTSTATTGIPSTTSTATSGVSSTATPGYTTTANPPVLINGKVCDNLLGLHNPTLMGDGHFSSSSSDDVAFDARNGRLNNTPQGPSNGGAWIPRWSDKHPHIVIDLKHQMSITGIITQGRPGFDQWVTRYEMYTSTDGTTFEPYSENKDGRTKVFTANFDNKTPVKVFFKHNITVRAIKIHPTEFFNAAALRLDLLTCDGVSSTATPSVHYTPSTTPFNGEIITTPESPTASTTARLFAMMELGFECDTNLNVDTPSEFPDRWISSFSYANNFSHSSQGRLGNTKGAWVPSTNSKGQWIQVDFQSPHLVTSVLTQGHPRDSKWVSSYYVAHSYDGLNYHFVKNDTKQPMLFSGNENNNKTVTNRLAGIMLVRYLRLYPLTWPTNGIALRVNFKGCSPGTPSTTSITTPGVPSTISTATPGVPSTTSTATPGVPSTTSTATPGVPSTTSTATPGIPSTTSTATPGVPSTTSTATPGVPSTTSTATTGVPSKTSTATPGIPSTTPTATPGIPSTTSSATPGVPSTTSTATPGIPSTTSTATPGVPSKTSTATPGIPSTTPTATPGIPSTTSSATPGLPSTTSTATPGIPSTTSTATPGVPSKTSTATPGIPSTTPTATPGIPSTTSSATPGVPSTTSTATPGIPSTTSTATPGVPSTTSTATPGIPSTTSTATPGIPSTTSTATPGVPSTTSTATPGVPSTTSTATPGVPSTTSTATPGVPSTTSTATPGIPSTSTTTPGIPSTTSTATPGVPSTTSTATPGVPLTTSTATPGVPSTTSTATPGVPSTTSTATPGVPSTTSTATPGVPSTTSTATPGVPSTTSTATPGIPSTTSTATPGVPSTKSTATPGVPSTTSTATPGIPSTTSTATPGVPSSTSTTTPGVPSTTSTATPGIPSTTSTTTPGVPSTTSTATPGVPSTTSTATTGVPSSTSTATPGTSSKTLTTTISTTPTAEPSTSDTPQMPCVKSKWLSFVSRSFPEFGGGDSEFMTKAELSYHCSGTITDISCYTKTGTPYDQTGDIVECSLEYGLVCSNIRNNHTCQDYMVRYWCQCHPSIQTSMATSTTTSSTLSTTGSSTPKDTTLSTTGSSTPKDTTLSTTGSSTPKDTTLSTTVSSTLKDTTLSTTGSSTPKDTTLSTTGSSTLKDTTLSTTGSSTPKDTTLSTTGSSTPKDTTLSTTGSSTPKDTTISTTGSSTPKDTTISTTGSSTPKDTTLSTTGSSTPKHTTISTTGSSTPKDTTLSTTVSSTPKDTTLSTTGSSTPKHTTISTTGSSTPKDTTLSTTVSSTPKDTTLSTTGSSTPKDTTLSTTVSSTPKDTTLSTTVSSTPKDTTLSTTGSSTPKDTTLSTTVSTTPKDTTLSTTASSTPKETTRSTTVSSTTKYTTPSTTVSSSTPETTDLPSTINSTQSTTFSSTSKDTTIPTTIASTPKDTKHSSSVPPSTTSTHSPIVSTATIDTTLPSTTLSSTKETTTTHPPQPNTNSWPPSQRVCISRWSEWIDRNTDTAQNGDKEMWEPEVIAEFCPGGQITDIHCYDTDSNRDYRYFPDRSHCSIQDGFACENRQDAPGHPPCRNYKIQYKCDCGAFTTPVYSTPEPSTDKIQVRCGWSPWLNADSPTTNGGDLETIPTLKQKYGVCPKFTNIECRVAGTSTSAYAAGQAGVKCDPFNGLRCYNSDTRDGHCFDYEVRLHCWDETCEGVPTPHTTQPTDSARRTTVACPPGKEWQPCAYTCSEVCNYHGMRTGACNDLVTQEDCVPGCKQVMPNTTCKPHERLNQQGVCVYKQMCSCLKPDGTPSKPMETWPNPDALCSRCSCFNNEIVCGSDPTGCSTTAESTTPEPTLPVPTVCGWSDWMNGDSPHTGNGDMEPVHPSNASNGGCSTPLAIECREATTHEDTRDTHQQVSCSVSEGLKCFNYNNNGNCSDYEIRVFCPCANSSSPPMTPTTTPQPRPSTPPTQSSTTQKTIVCGWTNWMSNHDNDTEGDMESIPDLRKTFDFCETDDIINIECRDKATHGMIQDDDEGAVCEINTGLACFAQEQPGKVCPDYEVRFMCDPIGSDCSKITHNTSTTLPPPITSSEQPETHTTPKSTTAPVCDDELGVRDHRIPDEMISGSSSRDSMHSPRFGRVGGPGSWMPALNNQDQYMQVDLGVSNVVVTGVKTQGNTMAGTFVKAFKVWYSNDAISWSRVKEQDNQDKVFITTSGQATTSFFDLPVRTRFIRLNPVKWHGSISMRIEILGCPYNLTTRVPGVTDITPTVPTTTVTTTERPFITTTFSPRMTESCVEWHQWLDLNQPSLNSSNDFEPVESLKDATPNCSQVVSIECRTATPDHSHYSTTGQNVECNTWNGLKCVGDKSSQQMCYNYEARLGCLKHTPECLNPPPTIPTCYPGVDVTHCPPNGCAPGFYCDGTRCVRKSDCPCVLDGQVIRVNGMVISKDCQMCQCFNGEVICLPKVCQKTDCPHGLMGLNKTVCVCQCDNCSPYEFQCGDGVCIPQHLRCDGVVDCVDDELDCGDSTTQTPTVQASTSWPTTPIIVSHGNTTSPPPPKFPHGNTTPTPPTRRPPFLSTITTKVPTITTTAGSNLGETSPSPQPTTTVFLWTPTRGSTTSTETPVTTSDGHTTSTSRPTISSKTTSTPSTATTTDVCARVTCPPLGSVELEEGMTVTLHRREDGCCREYRVCNISDCHRQQQQPNCPSPHVSVTVSSTECCPKYHCECPSSCPIAEPPSCPLGTKPLKVSQACNCSTFICSPVPSIPPTTACFYTRNVNISYSTNLHLPQHEEFQLNESWKDGPCRVCACVNGSSSFSEVSCTEQKCTACKKGETRIEKPGQCCNECVPAGCLVNGNVYKSGETIPSTRKCYTKICQKDNFGEGFIIKESHMKCPEIQTLPLCTNETKETDGKDPDGCCLRCIPPSMTSNRTSHCSTCSPQLVFGNKKMSIGYFKIQLPSGAICKNKAPLDDLKECTGYCKSRSKYTSVMKGFESSCQCCQTDRTTDQTVKLSCSNGSTITKTFKMPKSCACKACSA